MSQLVLLYQSEIDSHIKTAGDIIHTLLTGLDRQKEHQKNASVEYIPPPASGPQSRSQLLRDARLHVSQARELFGSMSSEISGLQSSDQRQKFQLFLQKSEQEAASCSSIIESLQGRVGTADREDLLLFRDTGSTVDDGSPQGIERERVDHTVEAQRRAALGVTATLQGGTSHLEKAESLLHRTNVTGHETLYMLRGQTEQIRGFGESAEEVDTEISESMAVIHRMRRTALKHKIYLLILMVVLVLVLLLYIISIFR